jgi:heptosyltransferase-2
MVGFTMRNSLLARARHRADAIPGAFAVPRGADVAVVQPLPGIGDMIWHLPHIRALAAAVGAPVTLVTKPGSFADQILAAEPSVRRVLWLRRNQGLRGPAAALSARLRFLADLRRARFDALVLLHHSRWLAAAALLAGIPRRYGYGLGAQRLFLNRPPFLATAPLAVHPFEQASRWLAAAGISADESEPVLPVLATAAAAVRGRLGPGRPPIAIGIGSSEPATQWGAERFASLLALLRNVGWPRAVLLGGAAEAALADEISRRAGAPAPALAIGWPLQEVAALLAASAFYVGNDTGAANIAAAVGIRAFVLFGATPPFHHSARIVPIVPESGVDRRHGMTRIAPEHVLAAIAAERRVPLIAAG